VVEADAALSDEAPDEARCGVHGRGRFFDRQQPVWHGSVLPTSDGSPGGAPVKGTSCHFVIRFAHP
jgi:hypothetical protein